MKWTDYSEDALHVELAAAKEGVKQHLAIIAKFEAIAGDIETELERRRIAAFWKTQDGLRLEPDDKLLITQELIDYKQKVVRQGHSYTLGSVWHVYYVSDVNDVGIYKISPYAGPATGGIPIGIVQRMRAAFLAQENES